MDLSQVDLPEVWGSVLLATGVPAFTIIAGVSSGLAGPDLGKKTETKLDADTVDGVLGKVVDALTANSKMLTDKEDAMISALNETIDIITTEATAKYYMPPRPEIAGYSDQQLKSETSFG